MASDVEAWAKGWSDYASKSNLVGISKRLAKIGFPESDMEDFLEEISEMALIAEEEMECEMTKIMSASEKIAFIDNKLVELNSQPDTFESLSDVVACNRLLSLYQPQADSHSKPMPSPASA